VRSSLLNDGYVVFKNAVPRKLCENVLQAIGTELGIWTEDRASWSRVSNEIDQVPLWGHQSQWDIRQLPNLSLIWSMVWGTSELWTDRNSCRFTPPWRKGRAEPIALHWDVDPFDHDVLWYSGIVALTDTPRGAGGFRCSPALMHNRDRWPTTWSTSQSGTEYRPHAVKDEEIVEVPLDVGDLLIFDSHLPHGTVRNRSHDPRVVFYLQMFPTGTDAEAQTNVSDHMAGVAPPWWRWKPGHDRVEPGPPATLNDRGKQLLGMLPY
jgi:hypothetical protein